MSKLKKFVSSPRVTLVLFVLAAALLLFSGIGGARAALTYYVDNPFTAQLAVSSIGVTLMENGEAVAANGSEGALLGNMLVGDEALKPGKAYDEVLSVYNSGAIDQFVRVSIYKYWQDADGKACDLSPELIGLNLTGNGWVVDEAASTPERTVLYYTSVLPAGGASAPLSDKLTISDMLATKVTAGENENGTYTITYDYDGVSFHIEAAVDAVQSHNAEDAILSAWGRSVTVSGGTLTLN